MEPEKWNAIKEGFNAAMECEAGQLGGVLSRLEPEIRAEVEKLIDNYERASDFIEAPVFEALGLARGDDAMVGAEFDGYRLIEQIGTGGMGAVYLAEHISDGVSHRVALKLVKRGMDTNAVLARFYRERRILAGLEHPNIARFLDAGAAPDGRPYIVMEHVEGISIKDHCERLSVAECLKLFRKVCAAVSFAHRNLVVHRDLKPSNILVTPEGEPKLLDFGIAKLLQRSDAEEGTEPTATLFRALTPDYASPEQMAGAKVTTASDVYSLGVVLYELLTGTRPFEAPRLSALFDDTGASTREPVKPSAVVAAMAKKDPGETDAGLARHTEVHDATRRARRRELAGDLDNITLKALRADASRRYASVEEFSEDIRRQMVGLPVTATGDSLPYRAAKFMQRHRTGVTAAAMALVIFAAAGTFAAWQAYRAERERAKAERRFNDVRRLANSIVFEVNDAITDVPGTVKARELLVAKALEYLDGLAAESQGDASLQLELADAYDKIGDIQSGASETNLGKFDDAAVSYARALGLREGVAAADPSSPVFRRALAKSYMKAGNVGWMKADVPQAKENYKRAYDLLVGLIDEQGPDRDKLIDLSVVTSFLARVLVYDGDKEGGIRMARETIERLESQGDGGLRLEREKARAFDTLAEIYQELGTNLEEARRLYQLSLETTERVHRADPESQRNRRDMSVSYLNLAAVSAILGDRKYAAEKARTAIEGFRKLAAEDPANEDLRQTVMVALTLYGRMLVEEGNTREAIESLEAAMGNLPQQKTEAPREDMQIREAEARLWLATAYVGGSPAKSSNCGKVRDHIVKSREIFSRFKEKGLLVGTMADRFDRVRALADECASVR